MDRPTVVWIDHAQARIFELDADGALELDVEAPPRCVRSKAAMSGRHPDERVYYKAVAAALHDAGEVLVTGPSNAKLAFLAYLGAHHAGLLPNIVGVETVDHPTPAALASHTRRYFAVAGARARQRAYPERPARPGGGGA